MLGEEAGHGLAGGGQRRGPLAVDFGGVEHALDSHIRNRRKKIDPDPTNPPSVRPVCVVGYRLGEAAE